MFSNSLIEQAPEVCTTKEFEIFDETLAIASSETAIIVIVALGMFSNFLEFICKTLIVSTCLKTLYKSVH